MKNNVESIAYNGNERIETVTVTYTLADDYITLGKLYIALGQKMANGEDVATIHQLIATQQEHLAGYSGITP